MATAREQIPFPPEAEPEPGAERFPPGWERYTPAQWLAWEERQPERWELIGDRPRMMAGGSDIHNAVTLNIAFTLRNVLQGTACRVRSNDLKVQLPSGRWVYPDVFVYCSRVSPGTTKIDEPILVIEVLSPGTSNYDLENKRLAYYDIPSLQHMMFIKQDTPLVELVTRSAEDAWRSVMFTDLDNEFGLDALNCRLRVQDIYADTDVAGAEAGEEPAA